MLTIAPPIMVTGMELTFRRDLPGFKSATHFVVAPLSGEGPGIFAHLRCTDTVYVQGSRPIDNLTLLVTPPGIIWRGYEVQIDEVMVEELQLSRIRGCGPPGHRASEKAPLGVDGESVLAHRHQPSDRIRRSARSCRQRAGGRVERADAISPGP